MKSREVVAIIKREGEEEVWSENVKLILDKKKIRARAKFLPSVDWLSSREQLIWLKLNQPAEFFWKKEIKISPRSDDSSLVSATIIDPAPDPKDKKYLESPRLRLLAGETKDMLQVLLREKGIKGLREKELADFSGLSADSLFHLIQEMELGGIIKILGFKPLFLISQESLNFLIDQLLAFIKRYTDKHPESLGVHVEKLRKRFRVPRLILQLALAKMEKETKIIFRDKDLVSLPSVEIALSPEELKILAQLEEMCYRGEFRRVSIEEIKDRFRLSRRSLEKLLSHLVARKKIFQSADGFYIHSYWLEEIIERLRKLGKKELTIAEFKAMTGLSRKYAIPLLELLDKMGITKRKGSVREIL